MNKISMPHEWEDTKPAAMLFDIDGVIVPEGSLYFSERLARDYGIPAEKIAPFFLNQFHGCLVGKLDIKEELTACLRGWGWIGSVDELLKYWFGAEQQTDNSLLAHIQVLRECGLSCYIASHQEKYRAEYLLENVGLGALFDGAFFSCYIGSMKYEPRYYEKVFESLKLDPGAVMFWDDSFQNIEAARKFGIDARHYVSYSGFCSEIAALGL